MPFFEFVPQQVAESPLRRELTRDELELSRDGTLALPRRPGLGVELDREALARFADAGRRRAS
jgi:L-alanine-DL-glutamate epimerase-like enolase superfamily enzyme